MADGELQVQTILDGIAEQIRQLDRAIERLQELLANMQQHAECFTPEEMQATSVLYEHTQNERDSRVHSLMAKIDVFESQISVLEQKLRLRKKIIESDENLEIAPSLVKVFQSEHVEMLRSLEEAKQFIKN